MKQAVCLTLLTVALLLSACDRREPTYYQESEITVRVDWSGAGQDEESSYGATLVVYPHNGGEPRVVLMGERDHTTVRLPQGRYDALLFNRSFDDFGTVEFRGMEQMETLEAYASEVVTRADTRVIVSSPDKLASAVVRDLEVTEGMLGNYATSASRSTGPEAGACRIELAPRPLTRRVEVTLHVEGLVNVREARCTLGNIPLSLYLHNGQAGSELGEQEFDVANPVLDAGSWRDGTLTGWLNVFGLDTGITHDVTLKALLKDNKTVVRQVLTNVSIEEETGTDGILHLSLKATTSQPLPDVKPEGGSDSGFDADVGDWEDEIVTEIPI